MLVSRITLLALCLAMFPVARGYAAVKTWDGTSSANWGTSANWTPSGIPVDGDDLVFPAGAANSINTNNITDLRVASITFNGAAGGYFLRGNAITLTNGVVAAHTVGDNDVNFAFVTNAASQTYTVDSGGTLDVNASVVLLGGFTLTINNDFNTRLDGAVSGTGNIVKSSAGTGTLAMGGTAANTYVGNTTVNEGTLTLGKTAGITSIPGDLFVGNSSGTDTVRLLTDNQIAISSDITFQDSGVLDLNGLVDTVGTLTFNGGTVNTGVGDIGTGNITVIANATAATINGTLTFIGTRTLNIGDGAAACDLLINAVVEGAGGIIKTGAGTLCLDGANTYTGATTLNAGLVRLDTNTGLGSSAGGVTVNSNAVLLLNNAHVTNEVLTLNSINSAGALQVESTGDWIGPITLNTNVVIEASSLLQLGGLISGPGGFTKVGGNTLRLIGTNVNTYAGTTMVNAGTLELNVNANNGAIPGDLTINGAFTVRLLASDQFNNSSIITINTGGVLDFNGFSDIFGGLVMTGGTAQSGVGGLMRLNGNLTVNSSSTQSTITGELQLFGSFIRTFDIAGGLGTANPDLLISAVISGSGGITVNGLSGGASQVDFSGANTYPGLTTLNDGFLSVQHASGLGSTAAGTVLSGGNLTIVTIDNVTVTGEGLTNNATSVLQGVGASGWTGPVVLNAVLNLRTVAGATTLDLSGVISGTGGITMAGLGTVIFSGAGGNSYTGPTTVNQGILELGKPLAINNLSLLTIGDSVGGVNADIVRYIANNGINSSVPILINESGLLDLNGFSDLVGALTLIGGDITTGAGTLTLNNNVSAISTSAGGGANISGNLALGATTRTFTVDNGPFDVDLSISAAISGSGGIIKTGEGLMRLSSSNSFSGALTVNDGTLRLQDDSAAGTTAGGVTVNGDAILQLISNTHVGTEALTLNSLQANGAVESVSGSNSWAGAVTLATGTVINVDAGDTLNLLGAISGPGALTKIDTGTLYFSGGSANTYAGVTTVNAGTLVLAKSFGNASMTNNLVIGDGSGGVNADVVRIEVIAQLPNTVAVTVNSSGLLEITEDENFGSLAGSGNVVINTIPAYRLAPGFDNTSTVFSGVISGPGRFDKEGTGTMTLSGNNTYTGTTRVDGGKLVVDGSQPQSHVTIGATGILGGTGTVGNINNTAGGVVSPGSSPGILTCSNVVFSGVSSDFTVELAGLFAGSGYDQLNVRGTNTLGGSTLNVTAGFGLSNAPAIGDQFTLLNNDGAEAITGTFAGLANNAALLVDSLTFRINYDGGSGNDVVLTLTNASGAVVGSAVLSGNGNATIDPNECNLINVLVSNKTGIAMSGITATLSSLTPGVTVVQMSSAYPNIPANQRRTNSNPFQISVASNFVCGENVQLLLSLQTSTHNSFGLPVVLNTGSPGSPVAFNNIAVSAIPDGGTFNSTLLVAGIASPVAKVTVSLNITYPQDQDLDVFLESPDGTIVELTTDNGGTGGNYGSSCTSRTTFDDAAGTAITAGAAPFTGTFRPEGRLSDFIGKSGANVNGNWTLRVTDDQLNGFNGTLNCWTLNLSPATCAVGSGICELCPEVTLSSALGTSSLQQTLRINRSLPATACGAPTTAATTSSGTRSYDAYVFRNGPSAACISVALTSLTDDVFSAAYTNSFNPANILQNYLADAGQSTAQAPPTTPYSFNVGANQVFVVTVNEITPGTGGNYVLSVTGGDCRPVLNIAAASTTQAVLDWTTAAAGYRLERTNNLTGAAGTWQSIATVPSVINSRFTVTNSVGGTNQFYRLNKPLP